MRSEFRNYDFTNHLSMFNVNVNGPFCHIQTLLNHMIKNRSGHIVAITSVQGKLSPSFRTSYAGSKHALIGILDSLRS
jgi:dehydrogenase/reductase SDR family protein 7B